jgi:hypothetical protein
MQVAWIEREPAFEWNVALVALVEDLGRAGFVVRRAVTVADAPAADAYVLVAGHRDAFAAELADAAARTPDRLRRIVLLGAPLDYKLGFPLPAPGTIAELLERYRLGGSFAPEALLAWQEVPSHFSGPKALMPEFRSNAFKALQSDNYANWFSTRGTSLADFLGRYLPALAEHASRETA